jgi:hypothetical protein
MSSPTAPQPPATTSTNGTQRPPAAAPPNPKQQAVTFALELAKIRATLPGASANRGTDVKQLIDDATAIAVFIGQGQSAAIRPIDSIKGLGA